MKPPEIDVGIDECAKYVRLALEQKYGIKIEPGHAWDMRYSLKIIWPADGINYKEILKKKVGIIFQGMSDADREFLKKKGIL